uniref:Uncharacterized protein n=1 Tax=Anguilla anguilla TaxID=7936 RepID=A0A0E9S379_ANGAN
MKGDAELVRFSVGSVSNVSNLRS